MMSSDNDINKGKQCTFEKSNQCIAKDVIVSNQQQTYPKIQILKSKFRLQITLRKY